LPLSALGSFHKAFYEKSKYGIPKDLQMKKLMHFLSGDKEKRQAEKAAATHLHLDMNTTLTLKHPSDRCVNGSKLSN
jgi:hypothetical protein